MPPDETTDPARRRRGRLDPGLAAGRHVVTTLLVPPTPDDVEPEPAPNGPSAGASGSASSSTPRCCGPAWPSSSSAGITSILGLAYWSLAARRYSPAAVGATAALLAAMEVVAAVANLGLKTALIRFVPALGSRAVRVVAGLLACAAAVAPSAPRAFVAVHGRWFPELDLLDEPSGVTWFFLVSVLWVVFILQDSVLVGLRRASWVPIENAVYAVAKLGPARRPDRADAPVGDLRLVDGAAGPDGGRGQRAGLRACCAGPAATSPSG